MTAFDIRAGSQLLSERFHMLSAPYDQESDPEDPTRLEVTIIFNADTISKAAHLSSEIEDFINRKDAEFVSSQIEPLY